MGFLFMVSSRASWGQVSRIPDWMTHGAGYAVLAVLACRALAGGFDRPVTARAAALAVAIAVLYGVTDELHQSFVPGRVADAWDLLKDAGGAVAGALACRFSRSAEAPRRTAA